MERTAAPSSAAHLVRGALRLKAMGRRVIQTPLAVYFIWDYKRVLGFGIITQSGS